MSCSNAYCLIYLTLLNSLIQLNYRVYKPFYISCFWVTQSIESKAVYVRILWSLRIISNFDFEHMKFHKCFFIAHMC